MIALLGVWWQQILLKLLVLVWASVTGLRNVTAKTVMRLAVYELSQQRQSYKHLTIHCIATTIYIEATTRLAHQWVRGGCYGVTQLSFHIEPRVSLAVYIPLFNPKTRAVLIISIPLSSLYKIVCSTSLSSPVPS